MYRPRLYREGVNRTRFRFFKSVYLESDLHIGVSPDVFQKGMHTAVSGEQKRLYALLEHCFSIHPVFRTSLEPLEIPQEEALAPELQDMLQCGRKSETGPMSSVAGMFARKTGELLLAEYSPKEVVVENGGDLWVSNRKELLIEIYAGSSPFSGKIALVVPPGTWGICSSSGMFGHSFSRGKADVVTVVCRNASLADAWASSLANHVRETQDVDRVLDLAGEHAEILSCVVIKGDRLGIRGELELSPLAQG